MDLRDLGRKAAGVFFQAPVEEQSGDSRQTEESEVARSPASSPEHDAAEPNENLVTRLIESLRRNQSAAWTFIDAYESLDGIIPDEQTRLIAALKTQKLKANEVVDSYAACIQSLVATETEYDQSRAQKREQTKAEHSAVIETQERRVADLQAQLQAEESKLAAERQRRDVELKKLAEADATFQASMRAIRTKLELASRVPKE